MSAIVSNVHYNELKFITCIIGHCQTKKFEATRSSVTRLRSGYLSTTTSVATTVEVTMQSMLSVSAHGKLSVRGVSRKTGESYGCVCRYPETVSVQVAT